MTISCLLVAFLAATCAAAQLTARELELQQFLVQAHRSNQLSEILATMRSQNNNVLPQSIEKLLAVSNLPGGSSTAPAPTPVTPKYHFKGMEKLTANETRAISVFLDQYFQTRDRELAKFKPKNLGFRVPRQACTKDDDCPFQQYCFDISEELLKNARKRGYTQFYDMVLTVLNIKTKECSPRFSDFMVSNTDNYMFVLRDAFAKLNVVVNKTKQISGMRGWIERIDRDVFQKVNFTKDFEEPLAQVRQGYVDHGHGGQGYGQQPFAQPMYVQPPQQYVQPGYAPQPGYSQPPQNYMYYPQQPPNYYPPQQEDDSDFMLIFLLMGMMGDDSTGIDNILPLLLLSGDGGLGGGDGGLSPMLLIALMGMGEDSALGGGDSLTTILLLTTLMGDGMGGGGLGDMLPLLLILMQEGANEDNDMLSLLPFLLLSGGGSATARQGVVGQNPNQQLYCPPEQGQNSLMMLLLFTSLFNVEDTGSDNLTPILLASAIQPDNGCPGSGGIGITEIILLQSLSGGTGGNILTEGNSLLPLLVLSGLGGGGASGGIDQNLLLLVLLGNSNSGTGSTDTMSSLLPILLLSDPNFSQNPLAFLLLFNDGLLGGGGTDDNSNMLLLLLFLSQGNSVGSYQPVTTPYGITSPVQSIPPPGGLNYQQSPGVQTYQPAPQSGGIFGGGSDIFTLLILTSLLGDGGLGGQDGSGSNLILLVLLLGGGGGLL